ncbi:MAG: hypothetical protein ACR2L1_01375 [Pyrinomonadaceae bacterium]
MKAINIADFKLQSLSITLLMSAALLFFGNAAQVFAHGGEDHGDEKPKVATTTKGTVSHTARLGDLEIMLKHPTLAPDTASDARLFITKFQTNEAFAAVNPAIEIESANGAVTQAVVEKTDTAGSFNVKIPALPNGTYTVRAKIAYNGETDTAVFSGVEVAPPAAETAGGASWLNTALLFVVGATVLGLFGLLFYFVWRMAGEKQIGEETVSV